MRKSILVGVDGRPLLGESTGVGRYLRNTLAELVELDHDISLRIYLDRDGDDGLGNHLRIQRRRLKGTAGRNVVVWTQWELPRLIRQEPVDLVHFPFYTMPLFLDCPSVVTIHDITFSLHPEWYPFRARISFSAVAPFSARMASRVLTVSECSRRDIVRQYKVPQSRITVTPLAADPKFTPASPHAVGQLTGRLGITPPYMIHLGSIHPRRNIDRLLDAFMEVADRKPDLDLILVGRVEAPYTEVESLIGRRALEGRVIHLGYAPEEDLPALITGAEALIYPSLYEGFGLPVLEAMACGTPVITSNTSALPETAGDAALLVDPTSREALSAAMSSILDEPALGERLRESGLRRAAGFSWRRTAEATLEAYRSVVKGARSRKGQGAAV